MTGGDSRGRVKYLDNTKTDSFRADIPLIRMMIAQALVCTGNFAKERRCNSYVRLSGVIAALATLESSPPLAGRAKFSSADK